METAKPKLKGRQKSENHGGKREGAGRKEGSDDANKARHYRMKLKEITDGANP